MSDLRHAAAALAIVAFATTALADRWFEKPELSFKFACSDLESAMAINGLRHEDAAYAKFKMDRLLSSGRCGAVGLTPYELESSSEIPVRALWGHPYPGMSQGQAADSYHLSKIEPAQAQTMFLPISSQ